MAVVALLGGAYAVSRSALFAVETVRVTGVPDDRIGTVVAASGITTGTRLYAVDLDTARAGTTTIPWVAQAAVRRVPPSTIAIDVVMRASTTTVAVGRARWQLDRDGVLMGPGEATGGPVVTARQAALPRIGAVPEDPALLGAVALLRDAPQALRSRIAAVDATDPDLELRLRPVEGLPDLPVRFGRAERLVEKDTAITLLLDQVRLLLLDLSGPVLDALDVRVPDRPVVVTHPRRTTTADGALDRVADG